jgi:cytochrome c oxidase subunit 4
MAYKQIFLARNAASFLMSSNKGGTFMVSRSSGGGHHVETFGNEKPLTHTHGREKAVGRLQVGYFLNGEPTYSDRMDFPYPAIRFQKDEGPIAQLREKEKGDWKKLTLEEKKALYRASFCATMTEARAPNGHWKLITALTLVSLVTSMWFTIFFKHFGTDPQLESYSNENKEKMMERMFDVMTEPVTGFGSQWDYEKNRWKA